MRARRISNNKIEEIAKRVSAPSGWIEITNDVPELLPGNYTFAKSISKSLNIDFKVPSDWDYEQGNPAWQFSDPHLIADTYPVSIGKDTDQFLAQKGGNYEDGKFILDLGGDISQFVRDAPAKYSYHTIFRQDTVSKEYVDRRDDYFGTIGVLRRGMTIRFTTGTDMTVSLDAGTFIDWTPTNHQSDPHVIDAQTPMIFSYIMSDGTVPSLNAIVTDPSSATVITNAQYEPSGNGTISNIDNSREVAHRVFVNPLTQDVKVLLAQHQWNTGAELLQKIGQEVVKIPSELAAYQYIGAILVSQGSTNYKEGNNSGILMASESGEVAGTGGSLSVTAPSYKLVADDSARDALTSEIIEGLIVGVVASADNDGEYAEYRVIVPGATWTASNTEKTYPIKSGGLSEWEATSAYKQGEFVKFGTRLYSAVQDNSNKNPQIDSGSNWYEIGGATIDSYSINNDQFADRNDDWSTFINNVSLENLWLIKMIDAGTFDFNGDGQPLTVGAGDSIIYLYDQWEVFSDKTTSKDLETVLIDADAISGTLYNFATGETWEQVKQNYERLIITGNASRSGIQQIRPWSFILDLGTQTDAFGQPGFRMDFTNDYSVTIWADTPANSSTGLRYRQSGGDAPTSGRMQFKVVGVKKAKEYIDPAIIAVDDKTSNGYFSEGNNLRQRGYQRVSGAGATQTTVIFPKPFKAGTGPAVTVSLVWNYDAASNGSLTNRSFVLDGRANSNGFTVRGVGGVNSLDGISWQAEGEKP